MKFTANEIALIALVAALNVAVGFVFYFLGSFLPVPGNKFIMFAPLLGFTMYMILRFIPRRGVIFATSTVFALIMINLHFFMGLAIAAAGITTETLVFVLFRNLQSQLTAKLAAACYPAVSFFWAFVVSVYLTGNLLFLMVDSWEVFILVTVLVYILGFSGTVLAERFVWRRLRMAKKIK